MLNEAQGICSFWNTPQGAKKKVLEAAASPRSLTWQEPGQAGSPGQGMGLEGGLHFPGPRCVRGCVYVCVRVSREGLEYGSPKNENGLGRRMSLPSLVFLVESCKGRSTRREPSLYYSPHVEEKTGRRNPQIVSLNVSREGRYIF